MSSTVNAIEILNADDAELMRISREGTLSLNLNEMKSDPDPFRRIGTQPDRCRDRDHRANMV